ncbi:MAG: hypothetical protein ACREN7_07435 [Candidatus Dormibacteria bacterium]
MKGLAPFPGGASAARRRSRSLGLGLALFAGLGLAGCSLGPGLGSNSAPPPSPKSTSHGRSAPKTSLFLYFPPGVGQLKPPSAKVTCGSGDHTLSIQATVAGVAVDIKVTGLKPGQNLTIPPAAGSFRDQMTLDTSGGGPLGNFHYLVGYTPSAYQGVGTIRVAKDGRSGTLNLSAPSPEGQAPTESASGDTVNTDTNNMNLNGTWACPAG